MGFSSKLTGALGVGGPKVKLVLSNERVPAGSMLTGELVITGGAAVKEIRAVELELYAMRKEPGQDGVELTKSDSVAETKIALAGVKPEQGQEHRVRFELPIPTNLDTSVGWFELVGGADVPGLDPTDRVKVDITGGRAPAPAKNLFARVLDGARQTVEESSRFHELSTAREFRHSSVRGDFRILPIAGGFVTSWKTTLVGRDADGSERFRIEDFGKAMAVSPDRSRIAAIHRKKLVIFDARTGHPLTERLELPDWIFYVALLSDGQVLAASSDSLFLVDANATSATPLLSQHAGWYIGGIDVVPDTDITIVADANGSKLYRLAARTGTIEAEAELRYPHDPILSADGSRFSVDASNEVAVFETRSFQKVWAHALPGKEGVHHPGHAEGSHNLWKPVTKLSPDGTRLLVNDRAGQLWVLGFDGRDIAIPRSVLDFVEDAMWADADHVLAITNDGAVVKLRLTDHAVLFTQQDV